MIKFGADNEMFYSMLSDDKKRELPAEGKFIREYVTSEYLQQFGMLDYSEIFIIPEDQLESECKLIVDRFKKENKIDFRN